MSTNPGHEPEPIRVRRSRQPQVETLEPRALLAAATETFMAPSISDLIFLAFKGQNTAPNAIFREVSALQAQLTSGPLADLKAGTVTGDEFITEVDSLVASFDTAVDGQMLPRFPNVDTMTKQQGARIETALSSLNQQATAGLITDAQLASEAQAAISALSGTALIPFHPTVAVLATRTQAFETQLHTLVDSLSPTATTPLTPDQVVTVLNAEAASYQADVDAALFLHPFIRGIVDQAVTTLVGAAATLPTSTDPQTQLSNAVQAFDATVLDVTGLFGPHGPLRHH
jgi:hypothetical protein